MTRYLSSIAVALVLSAVSASALASPASVCDESSWGLATGPVRAALLEGELGAPHRTCGRSEVALDGGGMLLVDLPNFYGRLAAALRLDGSWAWGPRGELFASWEFLRYDSLITPLSSSTLGIGHLSVGAAWRFVDVDRVTLGVNGKVVFPRRSRCTGTSPPSASTRASRAASRRTGRSTSTPSWGCSTASAWGRGPPSRGWGRRCRAGSS